MFKKLNELQDTNKVLIVALSLAIILNSVYFSIIMLNKKSHYDKCSTINSLEIAEYCFKQSYSKEDMIFYAQLSISKYSSCSAEFFLAKQSLDTIAQSTIQRCLLENEDFAISYLYDYSDKKFPYSSSIYMAMDTLLIKKQHNFLVDTIFVITNESKSLQYDKEKIKLYLSKVDKNLLDKHTKYALAQSVAKMK